MTAKLYFGCHKNGSIEYKIVILQSGKLTSPVMWQLSGWGCLPVSRPTTLMDALTLCFQKHVAQFVWNQVAGNRAAPVCAVNQTPQSNCISSCKHISVFCCFGYKFLIQNDTAINLKCTICHQYLPSTACSILVHISNHNCQILFFSSFCEALYTMIFLLCHLFSLLVCHLERLCFYV